MIRINMAFNSKNLLERKWLQFFIVASKFKLYGVNFKSAVCDETRSFRTLVYQLPTRRDIYYFENNLWFRDGCSFGSGGPFLVKQLFEVYIPITIKEVQTYRLIPPTSTVKILFSEYEEFLRKVKQLGGFLCSVEENFPDIPDREIEVGQQKKYYYYRFLKIGIQALSY